VKSRLTHGIHHFFATLVRYAAFNYPDFLFLIARLRILIRIPLWRGGFDFEFRNGVSGGDFACRFGYHSWQVHARLRSGGSSA
jgi:hypothetical protein